MPDRLVVDRTAGRRIDKSPPKALHRMAAAELLQPAVLVARDNFFETPKLTKSHDAKSAGNCSMALEIEPISKLCLANFPV